MKRKKGRYNIYIDEEVYEGLRDLVHGRGMSMSGYLEALIRENYEGLKVMQGVKSVEDINLKQLMTLFTMAARGMAKVEKRKKKTPDGFIVKGFLC